jgi:hypothetical protein
MPLREWVMESPENFWPVVASFPYALEPPSANTAHCQGVRCPLRQRSNLAHMLVPDFGSGAGATRFLHRSAVFFWWARGDLNPHILSNTGT